MMQWHSTPSWGKIFKDGFKTETTEDKIGAVVFGLFLIACVITAITALWLPALVMGGTYGIFWLLSFFVKVEKESKPETVVQAKENYDLRMMQEPSNFKLLQTSDDYSVFFKKKENRTQKTVENKEVELSAELQELKKQLEEIKH